MTMKATSHMKRQLTLLINSFLLFMLVGAIGCGKDEAPKALPKTVSQKIAVAKEDTGKVKPEKADAQKKAEPEKKAEPKEAKTEKVDTPKEGEPLTSDLIQESLKMASTYDATGRFDPFKPLFGQQEQSIKPTKGHKSKCPIHEPTPLQRVSLSQLKVTAIIRAPSGNRALVEDATGKGYVVKKGTYVGLNCGQVVDIDKDTIFIEEEIEDIMGELKINNAELKLQKPAGEL